MQNQNNNNTTNNSNDIIDNITNNNNKIRQLRNQILRLQNQLQTLQDQRDFLLEQQRDVELNGTLVHISSTRWKQIVRLSKRYNFVEGRQRLQCGSDWIHEFNFGDLLVDKKNDNEESIVVGESEYFVYILKFGDDDDGLEITRKKKATGDMVLEHPKRFWCGE